MKTKTMKTKTVVAAATLTALAFASAAMAQEQTLDPRIGKRTSSEPFGQLPTCFERQFAHQIGSMKAQFC
jgi:hypothetical protein